MQIIEGIMKLSAMKTTRQRMVQTRPMSAVQCFLSFIHWSMKMTMNIAVITKFRPSVSKWMRPPRIPPKAAPETQ